MAGEIGEMIAIAASRTLRALWHDDHLTGTQGVPDTVELDGSITVNANHHHFDLTIQVAIHTLPSSA